MTAKQGSIGAFDSAYRMRLADRIKAALIEQLGGQCALCGETFDLQFNHIYERDWSPHSYNRYRRMLRYRREAQTGEINLLCEACNRVYRPIPKEAKQRAVESPF